MPLKPKMQVPTPMPTKGQSADAKRYELQASREQALAQQRAEAKQWLLSLPDNEFTGVMQGLMMDGERWAFEDPDISAKYYNKSAPNATAYIMNGIQQQKAATPAPAPKSLGLLAPIDDTSGGGGGGGSTGGGTAVSDPSAYLAMMRALQLEEDQYTQDAAQQRDKVDRAYQQRLPEIERFADRSKRRVDTDFLGRGLFRSGARLRDLGEVDQERGRQVTATETGRNDALSAIEQELARRRANIETRRTEAGLNYKAPAQ